MASIVGGSVVWTFDAETGKFNRALADSERHAKDFGDNLDKNGNRAVRSFSSNANKAFDDVAHSIAGLAKVATGLFIGGAFGVGAFVKQASDLQSVTASFEAMTGSAEEAQKVLSQLNKFSFDTAFSTTDINAAARTLLGAGLAVEDLGDRMAQIGDIAGATGADLGRLTLPLSQAIARGKLQTQDFYQILDSGAGKLGQELRKELAQRGMGDFTKAMEEGQVTAEILFDVIEKSAAKGGFAFEGAIKQSKTFQGQMSNLQETIFGVGLEILGVNKATGEVDPKGIFAQLSKTVSDATKFLQENRETIKTVSNFIITNAVPAIGALAVAFTAAKVAAIGFAIAEGIALAPITLIVGAVIGLIAILTFLYLKFDGFREVVDNVINFVRNNWPLVLGILTGPIGLAVLMITKAFFFLRDNLAGIIQFLKDKFSDIGSTVGNALGNTFKIVINGMLGFLEARVNDIINVINSAIGAIDKITPGSLSRVSKISVPRLAEGGIVKATPGGILANIGEGGQDEAVIPLDQLDSIAGSNKGDVTINLNLSGIMSRSRADERDIAKSLVESINEELRAKGFPEIGGRRLSGGLAR